jgi:hypothetical protein
MAALENRKKWIMFQQPDEAAKQLHHQFTDRAAKAPFMGRLRTAT